MNFKIEKRDDGNFVVYTDLIGWQRPASTDEVAMWDRICELEAQLAAGKTGDRSGS